MMPPHSYPLAWPQDQPRTRNRVQAKFKVGLTDACYGIIHELKLLGATKHMISSDLLPRKDSIPYANQANPDDPGVCVYFIMQNRTYAVACDRYLKVKDNMQALRLTIEALRSISRWGTSGMMQKSFLGYAVRLPPPAQTYEEPK